MKIKHFFYPTVLLIAFIFPRFNQVKKPKILVFTKTNAVYHSSLKAGVVAIRKLGVVNGFGVDDTDDSTWFKNKKLRNYNAIVFLSCSGNVFGSGEEKAFQEYIRKGGGFVGIHAATTCEYDWPWYGKMIGAYYNGDAEPQKARLLVVNKQHPSTGFLPDTWWKVDEWYNFKNINPDIHVLIKIDEHSYKGGENGDDHPIAWFHSFEGGRVFYCAMGDADSTFSDSVFLKHILGGIQYAMGNIN